MTRIILFVASLMFASRALAQGPGRPVIDMHIHAHSLADYGGGMPVCGNQGEMEFPGIDPKEGISFARELVVCPASSKIQPAANDDALMRESIAMFAHHNIVMAVATGTAERVRRWRHASGGRIIPATDFDTAVTRSPDALRRRVRDDSIAVFAEITAQYDGVTLDDPRLEPYFALAEALDIPVGVHLGEGPAGGSYVMGGSPYRVRLGSPFQLEEVLVRHPRLRVYVMHYASPLVDEMIAMLYSHPQLYIDIAQNNWGFPRAHFYSQLRRLIDAGFAKRIMWGSDQMIWPGAIPLAIETISQAPFLSESQKRDIFYNNAARFLRLTQEEVARHHATRSQPLPD
ncbi:MAG TPA: amidohydrolase family protein [Longimicrobium sp.]|jgi:hypothetical protein